MDVKALSIYLLWGITLVPCVHSTNYEYHTITLNMNWTDAQHYCRDKYTDLATFESLKDLNTSSMPGSPWVWTGLFDDPASWQKFMTTDSNSWRWSATGTASTSRYQNWAAIEPNYANGQEVCVAIAGGVWYDLRCSLPLYFACYTVQSDSKQFTVLAFAMTWSQSLAYCRQHYQDLAMIENSAENQALTNKLESPTSTVWIGLFRKPWRWSDNSNSDFRNWQSGYPNNLNGLEHCAAIYTSSLAWTDGSCSTQIPFICQGALKLRSIVMIKITLRSSDDLSDPAINGQLIQLLAENLMTGWMNLKLKWTIPPTKQKGGVR